MDGVQRRTAVVRPFVAGSEVVRQHVPLDVTVRRTLEHPLRTNAGHDRSASVRISGPFGMGR